MSIFPCMIFLGGGKLYRNNFLEENVSWTKCLVCVNICCVYLSECVRVCYRGIRDEDVWCVFQSIGGVFVNKLYLNSLVGSADIYFTNSERNCFSSEKPEVIVPLSRVIRKSTFVFRYFG